MKKQLLTAILALASLAATAATGSGTFYLGGQSTWDGLTYENADGGSSMIFVSNYGTYSASQTILSDLDLVDLVPTTSADGTTTKAKITGLKFKVTIADWYGGDGSVPVTVYADNYEESTFPKIGSAKQWVAYTTEHTATASIDPNNEDLMYSYETTVVLTFDNPIIYEGKSLLLTAFAENAVTGMVGDFEYGTGSFNPANSSDSKQATIVSSSPITSLSGNLSGAGALIPILALDYELVEEKAGPSVKPGNPTTANIGTKNLNGASIPDAFIPLTADYAQTVCQAIYPSTLFKDIYGPTADGLTKPQITSLKFFCSFTAGTYITGSKDLTVYIQNYDENFPVNSQNKPQWVEFSSGTKATLTLDESYEPWSPLFEYTDDTEFPVTVTFEEPFIYEGNGLLITWVSDGEYTNYMYGNLIEYSVSFEDSGVRSAATSGTLTPTGDLTNKSAYLPYLEIGYTPLTYGATQDVVSFESVTYSTNVVTGTSSTSTRLNNLAVHFTINDPADHAPYTIKQGNDVLGTVSTKEGTINFFQKPAKDVILSVVPTGDAIGTTATVPADAFDAFFGAPTVEPVATGLWGEIDLKYNTPTKVDCSGVAQFRVTASTDAAYFSITSTGAQIITENSDLPEGFEGFYPAGAWNDIKACNGLVAYRKVGSIVSATLKGGMFTWPSSRMSIALGFGVNYPLVDATPAVSDGDVTPAAAPAKAGETKLVVKYNNGSSYGADQCSAVFDEASTLTHFSYVYPNDLEFRDLTETEGCIMFVAPEGHKLQHAVEELLPATPAAKAVVREVTDEAEGEHAWEDLDGQIATYAIDDYRGKNIHVRSIDGNGATSGHLSYGIDADGNVSGIADALAPAEVEAQWFNLQGIEIAEPAAAGIYIRRQGNSAVKVIIK